MNFTNILILGRRRLIQVFAGALLSLLTIPASAQSTVTVYEFYHASLNHYFRTADVGEANSIDGGAAGPGWVRTGDDFLAYPANNFPAGAVPVCRFYGSVNPGPNSHFYTSSKEECDGLKALQASTPATQKRWNYEGLAFAIVPSVTEKRGNYQGPGVTLSLPASCANGLKGIYRLYNDGHARGEDSNHRYTTSETEYARLQAAGWRAEGITMCATTQTSAAPLTISVVPPGLFTVFAGQAINPPIGVVTAIGGSPPYSFKLDSLMHGAPPIGTNVDLNGFLTGKPAASNITRFAFSVCVTDVGANSNCLSQNNSTALVNVEVKTGKANLTPYQPTGWSDKIVVAKTSGSTTDSANLLTTDTLYVSWAETNDGGAATSVRYYTDLFLDGVAIDYWYDDPPTNPGVYSYVTNYSIGSLTAGTHTLKIFSDSTGVIDESNESDNQYTKTFVVKSPTSTSTPATITANPSTVSMTAPVSYPSMSTVSKTITLTSPTPWTSSAPGFGNLGVYGTFLVSPNAGPAGATSVTISYTSYGYGSENGFIRFRTTTIGVYAEVPVTVN